MLLSFLLLITAIPFSAFADVTGEPIGAGSIGDDAIPVSNAQQLESMTEIGEYYLTNDIDLGGKEYTSFILQTFNGLLEGNGHSIYNFTINGGSVDSGMLQYVATVADTTIRNLQIGTAEQPIKMTLEGTTPTSHGLLAAVQGGEIGADCNLTVSGVSVFCDIQASMSSASGKNINVAIGGLIGATQRCFIYGCTVNGSIAAKSPEGQKVRLHTAGICGDHKSVSGRYQNCVNKASITVESPRMVARAAGIVSYPAFELTLENCSNIGTITGNANIARVGAIVSDVQSAVTDTSTSETVEYTVSVKNCANFGAVSATGASAVNAEAAAVVGHYENGYVAVDSFANYGEISSNGAWGTVCSAENTKIVSQNVHDFSKSPMHMNVGNVFGDMYLQTEYWNVGTVACQKSSSRDGNFSIRFIATVDKLSYKDIGFEGLAFYKQDGEERQWSFSKKCSFVYQSILASNDIGEHAVTADELGGNYLLALAVEDIPASSEGITFLLRPFFTEVRQDGSEQKYYGNISLIAIDGEEQFYMKDFSKNPIDNFRWSKTGKERADGADLRILSWNILSEELSPNAETIDSRVDGIAEFIRSVAPDAAGIQEISQTGYALLKERLGDTYTFVNEKNSEGKYSYTGIMYDHVQWELCDDGTELLSDGRNHRIRLNNWIYLKNRQTGECFALVSTHWETKASLRLSGAKETAALVKELETVYSCPVITTGDFNAKEGSHAFNTFINDSEQQEAKYVSAKAWNIGFSGHNVDVCYPQQDVRYAIDHITTTKTVESLYYEMVINEAVASCSDHFPIYTDLKLTE